MKKADEQKFAFSSCTQNSLIFNFFLFIFFLGEKSKREKNEMKKRKRVNFIYGVRATKKYSHRRRLFGKEGDRKSLKKLSCSSK